MIQTIPPGSIELNGIIAVAKTLALTVAGFALTAIVVALYHFNYGSYEAIAMVCLPPLIHLVVLWASKYSIAVNDPTTSIPQVSPTTTETTVPEV